jgi:hypothetical protein
MEAYSLPTTFYECIDRKNWSIDIIQRGLQIDDRLYTAIYTTIESQMKSRDILGSKLNTIRAKQQLLHVFAEVRLTFPAVFENIPEAWCEKCFTALAQKCNYNKRRRITRSRSPKSSINSTYLDSSDSLTSPPQAQGRNPSTRTQALEANTVLVKRFEAGQSGFEEGQSTICRMQDFVREGIHNNISLDDLVYNQFITVLQEDIMFDPVRDVISYCCTDDTIVPIRNERSWKAAIGEMYAKGLPRFVFYIKENGKRFSLPSFLRHILTLN